MRRWHYIYGLFSIKMRQCLYVGMSNNPINRLNSHILNRTTDGKRFEFTIFKRVKSKHARREEARTIAYYKSIGQATLNHVSCKLSLTRTISNQEAITFAKNVKHLSRHTVTESDKNIIYTSARLVRSLQIRNIRFKAFRRQKGFEIVAIVEK